MGKFRKRGKPLRQFLGRLRKPSRVIGIKHDYSQHLDRFPSLSMRCRSELIAIPCPIVRPYAANPAPPAAARSLRRDNPSSDRSPLRAHARLHADSRALRQTAIATLPYSAGPVAAPVSPPLSPRLF